MGPDRRTDRPVGGESARPGEVGAVLTLFVTDTTPSSNRARRELRSWMSTPGAEGVSLEIVDVLQHPELAEAEHVLATPALIRHRPLPRRKIIGDLSDWDQVSLALDLDLEVGNP